MTSHSELHPGVAMPAERPPGWSLLLRELRTARGMSLREAAARVGCVKGYLSGLERGLRPPPSLGVVARLERVLGVARGELFWAIAAEEGERPLMPRWVPVLNWPDGRAPGLWVERGADEGVAAAAACAGVALPAEMCAAGAFALYVRAGELAVFEGPRRGSQVRVVRAAAGRGAEVRYDVRAGRAEAAVMEEKGAEGVLHFFARIASVCGGSGGSVCVAVGGANAL